MRRSLVLLATGLFALASVPIVSAAPAPSCPEGTYTTGGDTTSATAVGPFYYHKELDGSKWLHEESNGWDGLQETDRVCIDEVTGYATTLYLADKLVASAPGDVEVCVPGLNICLS